MWCPLGAQLLLCMQVYMYVCMHEVTCIIWFMTLKHSPRQMKTCMKNSWRQ